MYDTHAQRLKPLSNQGGRAVCNQLMQRLMHSPLPALAAPCARRSLRSDESPCPSASRACVDRRCWTCVRRPALRQLSCWI